MTATCYANYTLMNIFDTTKYISQTTTVNEVRWTLHIFFYTKPQTTQLTWKYAWLCPVLWRRAFLVVARLIGTWPNMMRLSMNWMLLVLSYKIKHWYRSAQMYYYSLARKLCFRCRLRIGLFLSRAKLFICLQYWFVSQQDSLFTWFPRLLKKLLMGPDDSLDRDDICLRFW